MGRAGAGGGGHRSSGGGHRISRSGGGHRIGSGGGHSRAGSGSSGGSYSYRGSTPPPSMHMGPGMPPPPRRYRYYGHRHYGYGGYGGYSRFSVTLLVVLMLLGLMIALSGAFQSTSRQYSHNSMKSTIVRERIDTGIAYMNNCIIDEIRWFNNPTKTAARLKSFWEETGVQPYIILRAYDPSLTTDAQKDQWAIEYYDENFDTENIFLYVYFAEEKTDIDPGYMAYANGYQAAAVMDAEAMEIFWNYLDGYWEDTDMDTDDVFVSTFNSTAKAIMHVSTTGMDVLKWTLILCVVIIVGVVLVTVIKQRNKRAKEKAEEEAKILNTPIDTMVSDNLEDKYLK